VLDLNSTIHHSHIMVGSSDVEIAPVFTDSVKITVRRDFHCVTIYLDCATLERVFQAWTPVVAEPLPF